MKRFLGLASDVFWLGVTVAILVGGYLGYQTLGALRPEVQATPVERTVPIVSAMALGRFDAALPIRGEGFLAAHRQVGVAAQISGRIVELHPSVEARGKIRQGAVLARLDDRAARSALDRAEADIRSTQASLGLARTQLIRARELFERGVATQDQLDQISAQMAQLTAALASLEAGREAARITLSETAILAPFDGTVRDQQASLGAVVSPGQSIATLYTDARIEVTVPIDEAAAGLIPGLFEGGSVPARVTGQFAGRAVVWEASVARVNPALDSATRTLEVVVALDDPQAGRLATGADLPSGTPPALINAYVDVTIQGAQLADIHAIPSTALRDRQAVWLVDAADRLLVVAAEPIHIDGETTYVVLKGAPADARLITSPLDAPIVGMDLRVVPAPVAALSE